MPESVTVQDQTLAGIDRNRCDECGCEWASGLDDLLICPECGSPEVTELPAY